MEIFTPGLTYQYTPEGELDQSMPSDSMEIPATSAHLAPERFREKFNRQWSSHPGAWERLCFLIGEKLAILPDNYFVLRQAWLCGLIPIPDGYRAVIETSIRREAEDARALQAEREFQQTPACKEALKNYKDSEEAWEKGDEEAWAVLRRAGY